MKILLIQPPVRDFYFTAKRSIPYGLISIAASLREAGFEVELIDALSTAKSRIISLPEEMSYLKEFYATEDLSPFSLFNHFRYFGYSLEHLGNLIKKSGADLVGISSLFTAYSSEAHEIANLVKQKLPECKVVFGGHHPTAMPEKVLEDPAVDFVIRGDGEIAFVQLVSAIIKKRSLDSVDGLVYRRKTGLLMLKDAAIVNDLDKLPLPDLGMVNNKFYSRKGGGSTVILSSRGCPMKCTYCCVAASNSRYRKRSVDSVFSEMIIAYEQYGARFFDFEDENLTLDKKWFYRLLKRIKTHFSHADVELRAMNGLFPPTIDEQMLTEMKKAGFKAINLSLCTTSEKQLKRFRRLDVRNSVERIVRAADKLGIEVVCYIIAGAPGQCAYESVEDLIYLHRLGVVAGVSVFYPAPGSLEYQRTEEKGLLPQSFGLMRSSAVPVSDTTTRLEAITLLRLGRILNYMKKINDEGTQISARPLKGYRIEEPEKNESAARYLLEGFLYDGKIRGLRADGTLYNHNISVDLTKCLIRGIGF